MKKNRKNEEKVLLESIRTTFLDKHAFPVLTVSKNKLHCYNLHYDFQLSYQSEQESITSEMMAQVSLGWTY